MKRICVTGGAGFLGRAVCKALEARGETDVFVVRSKDYDLRTRKGAEEMFAHESGDMDRWPEIAIHLAATCGGIGANKAEPGRFFYDNMAMGLNVIEAARNEWRNRMHGVERFVLVGTVCSYPKHCLTPFREDDLWYGYPEETNAPYGVAKRALGTMLDAYRAQYGFNGVYLLPANLYGPGDNFDAEKSHVIPALIRKFCEAVDDKADIVELWGTGTPTREFLYVDDAAEAIVAAALTHNDSRPINLGTGIETSIQGLAEAVAALCDYNGAIAWNGRLDGQPRRCLHTRRASELLGWTAKTRLDDGLRRTIEWWRAERGDREHGTAVDEGRQQ